MGVSEARAVGRVHLGSVGGLNGVGGEGAWSEHVKTNTRSSS